MKNGLFKVFSAIAVLAIVIMACGGGGGIKTPSTPEPVNSLNIMADNQIKSAFDDTGIVNYCEKQTGVSVALTYKSSTSVRVANSQNAPFDAFWATSGTFVPNQPNQPVFTAKAYVGIATYPEVASQLGWDVNNLLLQNVLDGVDAGTIKWIMVNPSSGDPSSSFNFAVDARLVGETMLTQEGLDRLPTDTLKKLFAGLQRAPDNEQGLIDEIIKDRVSGANKYNTAVVYEPTLKKINKGLIDAGLTPMRFYYVRDATAAAKFPLAFTGKPEAKEAFNRFANCVQSDAKSVQILQDNGYRTSIIGMSTPGIKSEWGLDYNMADLPLIDAPRPEVALNALDLFQTSFKPKQRSAMCLDVSGSMEGSGKTQLNQAAKLIFDQNSARENGLTIGPNDVDTVFTFAGDIKLEGTVYGSDPSSVTAMASTISNAGLRGSTAMFDCVREAILYLTTNDPSSQFYDPNYPAYDPANYIYGVYVLTDGDTNAGWEYPRFEAFYNNLPQNQKIRIYGVGFGSVRDGRFDPLPKMVSLSGGIYLDGRGDLVEALKRLLANY